MKLLGHDFSRLELFLFCCAVMALTLFCGVLTMTAKSEILHEGRLVFASEDSLVFADGFCFNGSYSTWKVEFPMNNHTRYRINNQTWFMYSLFPVQHTYWLEAAFWDPGGP